MIDLGALTFVCFNAKSLWLPNQYQRKSKREVNGFHIDTSQFLERDLVVLPFEPTYLLVHSSLVVSQDIGMKR